MSNNANNAKNTITRIEEGFDATLGYLVDIVKGMTPLMAATTPLDDLVEAANEYRLRKPTLTGGATHPRKIDPIGWAKRIEQRAAHVANMPTPNRSITTKDGIHARDNEGDQHPAMVAFESAFISLFDNDDTLGIDHAEGIVSDNFDDDAIELPHSVVKASSRNIRRTSIRQ